MLKTPIGIRDKFGNMIYLGDQIISGQGTKFKVSTNESGFVVIRDSNGKDWSIKPWMSPNIAIIND